MPLIREHCGLPVDVEKQVKDIIKKNGGVINGSAVFLSTTSTAVTVTKETGVNRRAVMFIPHLLLSCDELQGIKDGEYTNTTPMQFFYP